MKRLFALLFLLPALAFAWEPTKPVTVVIGNTPGAGNEMAFRKLAEIVQKDNPKFVYVVQCMPGADSVVANNKFSPSAKMWPPPIPPETGGVCFFGGWVWVSFFGGLVVKVHPGWRFVELTLPRASTRVPRSGRFEVSLPHPPEAGGVWFCGK